MAQAHTVLRQCRSASSIALRQCNAPQVDQRHRHPLRMIEPLRQLVSLPKKRRRAVTLSQRQLRPPNLGQRPVLHPGVARLFRQAQACLIETQGSLPIRAIQCDSPQIIQYLSLTQRISSCMEQFPALFERRERGCLIALSVAQHRCCLQSASAQPLGYRACGQLLQHPVETLAPFAAVTMPLPKGAESAAHARSELQLPRRQQPVERRTHIVHLTLQLRQPKPLFRTLQLRSGAFYPPREILRVALLKRGQFAGGVQLPQRKISNRLQHRETRLSLHRLAQQPRWAARATRSPRCRRRAFRSRSAH